MGVVGRRDDHRVELVDVPVEGLAIVGADEGVGVLEAGVLEVVGIHVAQPGDLDRGMGVELLSVGPADGSDHADRQDVHATVGGDPAPGEGARTDRGRAEADRPGRVDEFSS